MRRAVAEAVLMDAQFVEQRQHQVRHGRVRRKRQVAAAFQLAGSAARHHDGQRIVIVLIAVAHAAAVEDGRMIQQIAVAIGRRAAAFPGNRRASARDIC